MYEPYNIPRLYPRENDTSLNLYPSRQNWARSIDNPEPFSSSLGKVRPASLLSVAWVSLDDMLIFVEHLFRMALSMNIHPETGGCLDS